MDGRKELCIIFKIRADEIGKSRKNFTTLTRSSPTDYGAAMRNVTQLASK